MHNQEQPQRSGLPSLRNSFNLLYILANAHATCFTPFIRHSFGSEALGWSGLSALLAIIVGLALFPGPGMTWFLWCWIAAMILQRIQTARLAMRGCHEHSQYSGYPWLAAKIPSVRSVNMARTVEPFLCLFIGVLLCPLDEGLGNFVAWGVVSMSLRFVIDRQIAKTRIRQMRDAELDQRALVRQYQQSWQAN